MSWKVVVFFFGFFVLLILHSRPSANRYFVEDGILQIINVSHRDQGVYTCLARTPMDGDKAAALLLVIGDLRRITLV